MYLMRLTVLTFLAGALGVAASDDFDMTFRENLRFGAEEDDPRFAWTDADLACLFAVGADGHIFVADQRSASIFEFDAAGTCVGQVAARGEGPGEYQTIASLSMGADGSGVGIDFRNGTLKAHYYGPGGRHARSTFVPNTTGYLFKADFGAEAGFMQIIRFGGGDTRMTLDTVTPDLQVGHTFASVPWPSGMNDNFNKPDAWVDHLAGQFSGFWDIANHAVGFTADGRGVTLDGTNGTLEVWSGDFTKKQRTLTLPVAPRSFTETHREELRDAVMTLIFKEMGPSMRSIITDRVVEMAIEKADLPPKQNHYLDLIAVEGGIMAAVVDPNYATGEISLDLIDVDRGFLGRVAFPDPGVFSVFGTRLRFRDGQAYAMVWNEDGENQMVRYAYKLPGGAVR